MSDIKLVNHDGSPNPAQGWNVTVRHRDGETREEIPSSRLAWNHDYRDSRNDIVAFAKVRPTERAHEAVFA